MYRFLFACVLLFFSTSRAVAADDDLPVLPDGFVVDVVAKEPMVSNPCVMAFDKLGRIFIGQGQQWRTPTPETPGDRIDILLDDDGDGIADRRKTFAEGFNAIQGLAWKGRDLWVANAPELSVVRDVDGDDVADEYIRVYTGLGNLEHALHGLNFGPDGRLYMSKGNSKGYNRLDQLAPKVFRDLWGLPSPEGAPDYTPIVVTDRAGYKRNYHTPPDDWGQTGGILRCDAYRDGRVWGQNLNVVSRGFRNPWDITFDDAFNWLGTDNDQSQGDKIFAPFAGAHFGWGHPWSYHWTGEGHLPTVPASAPLFEGSGAGVVYYHATHFPEEYRNIFFINDWMRREVYAFRPRWDGALLKCESGFPGIFAHAEGGRTLPGSSGRVFEPTDIEVGPDGALYVLSWGHAYGATMKDGRQLDAGRVYRIRHAASPLTEWKIDHRRRPVAQWSLDELLTDLGSSVPAWRVSAQDELVRRGDAAGAFLAAKLADNDLSTATQTWAMWTLGRLGVPLDLAPESLKKHSNSALQAIRIASWQKQSLSAVAPLPAFVTEALKSPEARLRHAAVLAVQESGHRRCMSDLLEVAAVENDRVTFYSTWKALAKIANADERRSWLADERPGVRLAALLGLLEDDALSVDEVLPLRSDSDARVADLVELWLQKTGGAKPLVTLDPPPGEYTEPVNVTLTNSVPDTRLTYTTDGSTPAFTSRGYGGPIRIDRNTTLKVIVAQDNTQAGPVITGEYRIRRVEPYRHRAFITDVRAAAPGEYRMVWTGIAPGKRHYTDRPYHITSVPPEVRGLPFLQTCNDHGDHTSGAEWLSMKSDSDVAVLVGVDVRVNAPLDWMKIGQPDGFQDTGLQLVTTDPVFRLYRKEFPAGPIVLGGSKNDPLSDSGRGMYVVIFDRPLLNGQPNRTPASEADVLAALETADAERGRELFFHPKGAGCIKCHLMEGLGQKFAPDLSDIGSRAKKAEILIQSILKPSAVITEGFAQQQIVTVEGKIFSGAVLEETGRSLRLVDSEGKPETILKSDIEERIGTKVSPMPAGFDRLMSAQQIADIVAWLMTQKSVGDRSGFSFRDKPDRIDIQFGEQRIATYLKDHPALTRRALVNVMTPRGIQVTRSFPSQNPEDDHPVMHPGIWFSYGDVDGNDYWRLQAKVVFDGFVEPLKGDRETGSFAVRNLFLRKDAEWHGSAGAGAGARVHPDNKGGRRSAISAEDIVCSEITRYRFRRVPEGLLLKLDAEYKSDDHDFYFGDQEESGLAVRVAPFMRVQGGNGTILNDRSERNGAEIWGKEAKWFDYFGTIDGREVGVMVVPDPGNPRPSWLHARDYGVVVTNPFPKQPRERREPYIRTPIRRGTSFRLSYAILIHDLPAGQPIDHNTAAEAILKSFQE